MCDQEDLIWKTTGRMYLNICYFVATFLLWFILNHIYSLFYYVQYVCKIYIK